MTPADVSIVVPTFNEADGIAPCIDSARAAGAGQIIIADGGSNDATVEVAERAGADEIVNASLGRGVQLNAGAALATGTVLLFLHADNRLGAECLAQICQLPELQWGAYRQQIDSPKRAYRAIEFGNALRVSWRGMPFGDQAIFVRRELYQAEHGFADIPLMEDYEFSQRLRKIAKPALLDGPVRISARRWEQQGLLRQTIRNWTIQLAYGAGVSPKRLAEFYRST